MASFDFTPYAVGGATRPDTFSGLNPQFLEALGAMFSAAPPDIQQHLRVMSGYRSPEKQKQLWEGALKKYGDPEIADNWVAPPGRSNHNHGEAVDLRFLDPAAQEYAHAHAADYGLNFPLKNEPWHVEPIGIRGKGSGGGGGHSVAPPLAPAREVASLPVAEAGQGAPAPAPATVGGAPQPGQMAEKGGLAAIMEAMAPAAGAMGAPKAQGQAGPMANFGSGDPAGAVIAGQAAKDRAKGLVGALAPNIDALMAMGRRPNGSIVG